MYKHTSLFWVSSITHCLAIAFIHSHSLMSNLWNAGTNDLTSATIPKEESEKKPIWMRRPHLMPINNKTRHLNDQIVWCVRAIRSEITIRDLDKFGIVAWSPHANINRCVYFGRTEIWHKSLSIRRLSQMGCGDRRQKKVATIGCSWTCSTIPRKMPPILHTF